jgi:exosortase
MAQTQICSVDRREGVPQSRGLGLGRSTWIWTGIVAGLYLVLFRHEIGRLVGRWAHDASWSHGFLIPWLSLYFVHQRRSRILQVRASPSLLGCAALVFWICVYVFNSVSPSGYAYLRSLSMILALASIVLFLGGWGMLRQTWFPILYLLFAVPLPDRAYVAMTLPLRVAAAGVAAALLDLVPHVEAVARGAVIDVIYRGRLLEPALDVAEACSGMRLLVALAALGVALAYLHDRPRWQRGVLLACTVPIAILCNLVRVTLTGFIYVLIGPQYAQGLYHDLLGLAMLPLALGAYSGLAWFMSSLFVEDTEGQTQDVVVRKTPGLPVRVKRPDGGGHMPCDGGSPTESGPDRPATAHPPRRVQPAILACAAALALCGAAMSALTADMGLSLQREPPVLRRPLDQMEDSALAPFRIVSRLRIEDAAVLKSLGTQDYVQWAVREEAQDEAGAGRSVLVFITFYGQPDRVPHVPEECYVGAGFQCLTTESVSLQVGGPGQQRTLPGRYLVFGPTHADPVGGAGNVPVLYLFRVNGRYAATRDEVRRTLNRDLLAGRSYFSKVELVFGRDAGLPPDKTQALEMGQRLLTVLLAILEKDHWPDGTTEP